MDRNGDGWNDIFVGTGFFGGPSNVWYWYERHGGDLVQRFQRYCHARLMHSCPHGGTEGWKNMLYLNDRKGGFTAVQNALTVSKESTLGVALGDLDAVRIAHALGSTLQPCL